MRSRPSFTLDAGTGPDYLLIGGRVAVDASSALYASLLLRSGRIAAIYWGSEVPASVDSAIKVINLQGHLTLPGLINVHDHLHFGTFPRLGHGPYPSWREWAQDIHHPEANPLRDLLAISKDTRLWSGAVRNALAGVTTVCHHDSLHPLLTGSTLPVKVHTEFGWAHSLDDPDWVKRYRQTPSELPFIVHFAESLDSRSLQEVTQLKRRASLDGRLVLVHAIGVSPHDWLALRAAGVWVVWCPTSNLHILGRTLAHDLLLSYSSIALGNDSPISAAGDLIDEVRAARELLDIPPDLLYRMVTSRAARLLRLNAHEGTITEGGAADLLVVQDQGQSPSEALASLARDNVAAVLCAGKFTVASEEIFPQLCDFSRSTLSPLQRYGLRWHIAAPPEMLSLHPSTRDEASVCWLQTELTNQ